jgi:hypothetical protein
MAGVVSVRVQGVKGVKAGGQVSHDSRKGQVPGYVDKERSHENKVLLGSFDSLKVKCQEQVQRYREFSHKEMRKDANLFIAGVITFDREAKMQVDSSPPDAQAKDFVESFCRKYKTEPVYLVRHSDESTVHYHFMTENIDKNGKAVTNQLNRPALKSLQDEAGQVFSAVGLSRGVSKIERIQNGEPTSAYIHRSVKELHEDLPAEIARAQAQASKWKRLAEEKRMKLQAMEQEEKLNVEKIEKTRQTLENHERREKEWVAKLDEMEKAYRSITRYVPRITAEDMPGAFGSKEKAAERINSKVEAFARPILVENETLRQKNRLLEIDAAKAKDVPKLETKIRFQQEQIAKIKAKLDNVVDFVKSRGEEFAEKFWKGAEAHGKQLEKQQQSQIQQQNLHR